MTPFETPIYVTRPNLPAFDDVIAGLREIWDNRWLTNRGPVLRRFEQRVAEMLRVDHLSVFTNGTLALELGLQALGLTGEVVTTPFTFAASVNALVRAGLTPVFADIEPDHLNLDPDRVEAAITPRTSAILAVHVFGHPCRLERLAAIAERHSLRLIYDAAHAFGVTIGGESIARFGDMTMFSLHATKQIHSLEGGALAFHRAELKGSLEVLANHGLEADGDVLHPGTNAKMNEIQALTGMLMLDRLPELIARGRAIEAIYRERLASVQGIDCLAPPDHGVLLNHAFMPVMIDEAKAGLTRDELHTALLRVNVVGRKYFYPAACDMAAFRHFPAADPLRRARDAAQRVLALPTYATLPPADVHRICDLIIAIRAGEIP
jgi:dTDP-4-amino-4,6-dideoxygalactose transaminase